ncbi:MAG: hypothetical protein ABQ298_12840 [Puniceicoccaceae bacterium]
MNAFDSVELEPISGPVPPEPVVNLWPAVFWTLGGIAFVALLAWGCWFCIRCWKQGSFARKPRSVYRMQRLVRRARAQKDSATQAADIDALWSILQEYLIEMAYVKKSSPTLEEIHQELDLLGSSPGWNTATLQHLISQVEQIKYVGPESRVDPETLRQDLISLLGEIIAHHR